MTRKVDCRKCPCYVADEYGRSCNLGFTIKEGFWIIEDYYAIEIPISVNCALRSIEYGTNEVYLPIETELEGLSRREAVEKVKQARAAKTIEDMGGLWNGLS